MRQLRMLILAAFTMLAFGAVASAVASAEDGQPAILILSESVTGLTASGTGAGSTLETLGKLTITSRAVTATVKGCKALEAKATDTNECEGLLTFTETESKGLSCRSETAAKVKDAVGTLLVKLGLKLAAEDAKESGVLEPLLIAKLLGADGNNELTLNCGTVKEAVKGSVGCLLLKGLENIPTTAKIEIVCEQKGGDQTTGTCLVSKAFCEALAKDPLLGNLNGTFEDSAQQFKVTGSFNKDVFIDD
jgi:hypothetical protein